MIQIPHIILADNQSITRRGVIALLEELMTERVIEEVAGYRDLQALLRRNPRSLVVVDYSLFDFQSLSQMINMKSGAAESSWLLFTDEPDEHFLRRLLLADPVISVVTKQDSLETIRKALLAVSKGDLYRCEYAESVMRGGGTIWKESRTTHPLREENTAGDRPGQDHQGDRH